MQAVTPRETQTARFQEKRDAILSAASLRFNELGVKGATLADIAGSVGLVTNSVTYYYRKKEDLAAACFVRAISCFDEIARAAAQEPTVAGRLRDFLRRHAALLAAVALGEHWPLVQFGDLRALPSPQLDEVDKAYTDLFRHVRALFKGPESAGWSRETLNVRTHMLMSTMHWMPVWIGRYEEGQYTRAAERAADIALHGLNGAGAAWPAQEGDVSWRVRDEAGATAAFLRAATALVNEQGYRGASVDKISARLNVTKGSFYHHHDNKLDLISACFERTFAVFRQAIDAAETTGGSGWNRACAATRALVRFQLSSEGPLLRMSSTSAMPALADRNRVHGAMQRLTERMGSVLVDGLADGSVRPLDPSIAAQFVVGMINAAAELHRWVPGVTEDSVVELLVRPTFLGLLSPQPDGR